MFQWFYLPNLTLKMENNSTRAPYAHVIIKLLQGPVYADDKSWKDLQKWDSAVHEYFSRMGLELKISDDDGFARIIQPEADEKDDEPLPRLMRKQTIEL